MKEKWYDQLWAMSLLILGGASIILFGSKLLKIEYSQIMVRAVGMIELITLPIFSYTTVMKLKKNKQRK